MTNLYSALAFALLGGLIGYLLVEVRELKKRVDKLEHKK